MVTQTDVNILNSTLSPVFGLNINSEFGFGIRLNNGATATVQTTSSTSTTGNIVNTITDESLIATITDGYGRTFTKEIAEIETTTVVTTDTSTTFTTATTTTWQSTTTEATSTTWQYSTTWVNTGTQIADYSDNNDLVNQYENGDVKISRLGTITDSSGKTKNVYDINGDGVGDITTSPVNITSAAQVYDIGDANDDGTYNSYGYDFNGDGNVDMYSATLYSDATEMKEAYEQALSQGSFLETGTSFSSPEALKKYFNSNSSKTLIVPSDGTVA